MTTPLHGQADPGVRSRATSPESLSQGRSRREREVRERQDEGERQVREQQLENARERLLSSVHRVRDGEGRVNWLEGEVTRLDTEIGPVGRRRLSGFEAALFGPCWLILLWIVDIGLLSATLHFIVSSLYGMAVPLWLVIPIPMVIGWGEVILASLLAIAQSDVEEGMPGARARLRRHFVLAMLLAIVLPCAGAAPHLLGDSIATSLAGKLVVLVILGLGVVFHATTLFQGGVILPALRRSAQAPHRWWLATAIRNTEKSIRGARADAPAALRSYETAIARYEGTHGLAPRYLRIPSRDATLVNHAIGEEVVIVPAIETPAEPPQRRGSVAEEAPLAQSAEPVEPQDNESVYLRTIIDAGLRDADGEITDHGRTT